MKSISNSESASTQLKILPVILWVLPVLAINLGFFFLSKIDLHWKTVRQEETAQQELEALTAGGEFSYQLANRAGKFMNELAKSSESLEPKHLLNRLESRRRAIFRAPFPKSKFFVFKIDEQSKKTSLLIEDSPKKYGRRTLGRIFKYLVDLNLDNPDAQSGKKQNEKLLSNILGRGTTGLILAMSQRGRTTFVVNEKVPHYFFWDFRKVEGKGVFGTFILVENTQECDIASKLLAISESRSRGNGLAGFVPIGRGQSGCILTEALGRSRLFKQWRIKNVKMMEDDILKWIKFGSPKPEKLGNFKIFSYLGKRKSHLTVFVMPFLELASWPLSIKVMNFIFILVWLFFLWRGFFFGLWPQMDLKFRFIKVYLLGSTIPISLLVILTLGYLNEFRFSRESQISVEVLSSIKQFDARKSQVLDEYLLAINSILADNELKELIKKEGTDGKNVLKRLLHFFKDRKQPLPVLGFLLTDIAGKEQRYYENSPPEVMDPAFNVFRLPILKGLRNSYHRKRPDEVLPEYKAKASEAFGEAAYNSISPYNMAEEIEKRRSFPLYRKIGELTTTQVHDFLIIDGVEQAAIFVLWDDKALDKYTAKETIDHFGVSSPEYRFVLFNSKPQGLSYLIEPGRHIDGQFKSFAHELAKLSAIRGSFVAKRFKNYAMVAMPAKKYSDTIIVGGVELLSLHRTIQWRWWIVLLIIFISVLIVPLSAYLSSSFLLSPITILKNALERVAEGDLSVKLSSNRTDQLGDLYSDFSKMVTGVEERKKLATLISDQALEALAKNSGNKDGILEGSSFDGVAFVSDIRNFTSLCESEPPEKITALLNQHFAAISIIISEHGGRIYKFIGDAVEAIFPDEEGHAASNAFKASCEILKKMRSVNEERKLENKFSYKIGIGLAYGKFFSGTVGSLQTRLDFSILSEALKKAAELESLSRNFPEFPLVLDKKVSELLSEFSDCFFSKKEVSHSAVFVHEPEIKEAENNVEVVFSDKTDSDINQNIRDDFPVKQNSMANRNLRLAQFGGLIFIFILLIGLFGAFRLNSDLSREYYSIQGMQKNIRLLDQIKCEKNGKVAMSGFANELVQKIQLAKENGVKTYGRELVPILEENMEHLARIGLGSSTLSVISLSSSQNASGSLKVRAGDVFSSNVCSEQQFFFKKISSYAYAKHMGLASGVPTELLAGDMIDFTGKKLSISSFFSEWYGKVSQMDFQNRSYYCYWNFLRKYKPVVRKVSIATSAIYISRVASEASDVFGMLFWMVPVEDVEDNLPLLVEGLKVKNQFFAIEDNLKGCIVSKGFPVDLREEPSGVSKSGRFRIDHGSFGQGNRERKVTVAFKIPESFSVSPFSFMGILLVLLSIFAAHLWLRILKDETVLARSLPLKLWFSFLFSTLIPVVSLSFVFFLFFTEHGRSMELQKRIELQRFLDGFEIRQYYSNHLVWSKLKEFSNSPELAKAIKEFESQENGKSSDSLQSFFDEKYKEADSADVLWNLSPRNSVLVSSVGKDFSYSVNSPGVKTEFEIFLTHVGRSVLKQFNTEKGPARLDIENVKSEMIFDDGLASIRASFGEDKHLSLVNGIGMPVELEVVTGAAGILIQALPSVKNFKRILFWMIVFEYSSYLEKVANRQQSEYAVFSISYHRSGMINSPTIAYDFLGFNRIVDWIESTNFPVSASQDFGDSELLIEARPGIAQLTSMLIGVASAEPIRKELLRLKWIFLLIIVLGFFVIFYIAKKIVSDVLSPIKKIGIGMEEIGKQNYLYRISESRTDELGDLCNSFDYMTNALAEKELMGKMVSKSAMKIATVDKNDDSLREGALKRFAILMIGIPGFTSWLSATSVQELFSDLRIQIAELGKIILQNGGDIDKIIGDKLLVVFSQDEDDSNSVGSFENAIEDILKAEVKGLLPFPVAIGANAGLVISGFLGVGEKRDFTVIGDAVNVAARIEAEAEKLRFNRCLISEAALEIFSAPERHRFFSEVDLKGKSKTIKLYQHS